MKKLIILFLLIFSCNNAFALEEGETAKLYVVDGDYINGQVIDATGYTYGIAMDTPGVAHITDTVVMNAGTGFMTGDARHGDGRGVYVTGPGAILKVRHVTSQNNTEDGYRVNHGGMLYVISSVAANNLKNGFFVGTGGSMLMEDGSAWGNLYGFMSANGFLKADIWESHFYQNKNQGMQLIDGQEVNIHNSFVYDNNTEDGVAFGKFGEGNFGGISVHGTKKVTITNTEIYNNVSRGFFGNSDSTFKDYPARIHIEGGKITGHGDESVISQGDSVITIINTALEGKCYEEVDPGGNGKIGIITVDGEAVTSGEDCVE